MPRALVESSLALAVTTFASRIGDQRQLVAGVLRWTFLPTDESIAEAEYQLDLAAPQGPCCILTFMLLDGATPVHVHQRVKLVTTYPHFGGIRWWFLCPGSEQPCGRRCHKLYLPAGGDGFACRACHGLVYTSTLA